MRKKIMIVATIFILCFIILIIGVSGDDPPSPSVEKALSFRLQAPPPEDNAYVGISGMRFIEYDDVAAAGVKFLKGELRPDAEPQLQIDISYRNPCFGSKFPGTPGGAEKADDSANCLEQIVAEAQAINEAVRKNAALIERYRAVQSMPLFVNTTTDVNDPIPMYQPLIESTRLLGAQALLDVKRGNIDAGLEALETELAFFKKIASSEYAGLIDLMIAMAGTQISFLELSKIIEDPQIDLAGHERRLRQMLDLSLNANQMMARALESEKRCFLSGVSETAEIWFGQEMSLKERFRSKSFKFLYKKNMTLNRIAARTDEVIQRFEAAPLLGFPDFAAAYAEAELKEMEANTGLEPTVKELYDRYGLFFFKNYAGEAMTTLAQPLYMRYWSRINDAVVYSRLLLAALELRLMDSRPEDLSEALAGLGPETWNPYTGQPFNWDRERNTIWGEKANQMKDADPMDRRMEVKI